MSDFLPLSPVPPVPHDPANDSGYWGTPDRPCPSERLLASYVDGELDRARRAAVDSHIDSCAACIAAARRLEGLSGLLKDWDARRAAVAPAPRLFDAVLKEVSQDAALRRRSGWRVFARVFAAAAAVLLAAGGGAILGAGEREVERAAAPVPATVALDSARRAAATPRADLAVGPISVPGATLAFPPHEESFGVLAEALRGAPNPADGAVSAVLSDPRAVNAFAMVSAAAHARRLFSEDPCIWNGLPFAAEAIPEFRRVQREWEWVARRERRLRERLTLDPSDTGWALAAAAPLPAKSAVEAFLTDAPKAGEGASARRGGIVVRWLSEGSSPAGMVPGSVASVPANRVEDLVEAWQSEHVRLSEDLPASAGVVHLWVNPGDLPVFVPAGELIRGGIVDRVVARGAWLPASKEPYPVHLACRAVSRETRAKAEPLVPTGAIAGPGLRGLLAIGGDAATALGHPDAVLALADAQLDDVGVPGGAGKPRSLLSLYRYDSFSDVLARAEVLLEKSSSSTRGFLATDPSGRWQGAEWTNLPPASARGFLKRVLAGYLVESGTRSKADGIRVGSHVQSVLASLSDRPVRLLPVPGALASVFGDDPATGVAFDAVLAEGVAFPLVSGLLPEIR